MKCWHCTAELMWNNDFSIDQENEDYSMETNLSCPQCGSFVIVYLPKDKNE